MIRLIKMKIEKTQSKDYHSMNGHTKGVSNNQFELATTKSIQRTFHAR